MKLITPRKFNPGDNSRMDSEPTIKNVGFNIYKFNKRRKPKDTKKILIISCFSEFGCEVLGTLYCLPRLLQEYPGFYTIVVGWYGREYFYRHLADEYWEIKEEHQWLREYCRAFHHESKNLTNIEKELGAYGNIVSSHYLGRLAVGAKCETCNHFWGTTDPVHYCERCSSRDLTPSLFSDVNWWKEKAKRIPLPSKEKLAQAKQYLKPKSVGIFARGRKCYGRNLQPEFYVKLISLLEEMGYNPIWMGEKASTQPCPVSHILDFSRLPESKDLELSVAIISKLKFTVQFWTASTRLASMVGTPYLLFESPDQIWGNGQEGYRRNLCDFGPSKLVISHYLNVYEDNDAGIELVRRSIKEMKAKNYEDIFGLLENEEAARSMKEDNNKRIGGS